MTGSNVIRYTVDEMRQKASELEALSQEVEDEANTMKTLIDGLNSDWAGDEYQKFIAQYDSFRGHQENFAEAIAAFGKYLKLAADRSEDVDSQAASNLNIL